MGCSGLVKEGFSLMIIFGFFRLGSKFGSIGEEFHGKSKVIGGLFVSVESVCG